MAPTRKTINEMKTKNAINHWNIFLNQTISVLLIVAAIGFQYDASSKFQAYLDDSISATAKLPNALQVSSRNGTQQKFIEKYTIFEGKSETEIAAANSDMTELLQILLGGAIVINIISMIQLVYISRRTGMGQGPVLDS